MGTLGTGDSVSPRRERPAAGQGPCPCTGSHRGVMRGPWGPSPSRLAAAVRGLPGFPWRPAAFSLSPFFLRFPISRSRGPAGSRPRRGAAGRGEGSGGGLQGGTPGHPAAASTPGMPGHAAGSSPAAVGAFLGALSCRRRNVSQGQRHHERGRDLLPRPLLGTATAGDMPGFPAPVPWRRRLSPPCFGVRFPGLWVGGAPRGPTAADPLPPSLSPADKLFGKRLLQAGRYIMSHKAWMKTVPTENCDVLMTFPGREMPRVPGVGARADGAGVEHRDGGTDPQRGWGMWGGMGTETGCAGRRGPR